MIVVINNIQFIMVIVYIVILKIVYNVNNNQNVINARQDMIWIIINVLEEVDQMLV